MEVKCSWGKSGSETGERGVANVSEEQRHKTRKWLQHNRSFFLSVASLTNLLKGNMTFVKFVQQVIAVLKNHSLFISS